MSTVNLTNNGAQKFAEEITKIAMQNNLIAVAGSPKDTAQAVLDFYSTILDGVKPGEN